MSSSPTPYYHPASLQDRYVIKRRLGSGSLGTVYLAHDRGSGKDVALKLIRSDRLSSEAVARLQKEFRALAGLHLYAWLRKVGVDVRALRRGLR